MTTSWSWSAAEIGPSNRYFVHPLTVEDIDLILLKAVLRTLVSSTLPENKYQIYREEVN